MLNDDPSKLETAEERARRYWRNNRILSQINEEQSEIEESINQPIVPTNNYLEQLAKFKYDIRRIILQRPTEMLTQYLIAIQVRKNKLLREKLRRLEQSK